MQNWHQLSGWSISLYCHRTKKAVELKEMFSTAFNTPCTVEWKRQLKRSAILRCRSHVACNCCFW
jgi:hypothetical protein